MYKLKKLNINSISNQKNKWVNELFDSFVFIFIGAVNIND